MQITMTKPDYLVMHAFMLDVAQSMGDALGERLAKDLEDALATAFDPAQADDGLVVITSDSEKVVIDISVERLKLLMALYEPKLLGPILSAGIKLGKNAYDYAMSVKFNMDGFIQSMPQNK